MSESRNLQAGPLFGSVKTTLLPQVGFYVSITPTRNSEEPKLSTIF